MRASLVMALAAVAVAGCATARSPAPRSGLDWRVAYDGYGDVVFGRSAIELRSAIPRGPGSTHAALVLSRRSWHDLVIDVRVRTSARLRRPRPNPWEVGWVLWHYRGATHFYYLALKPNGWELGKEEPGYPGDQRYLATGSRPRFPPGRWYTIRVRQTGPLIVITVDGTPLVRLADTAGPYLSGRVGLYVEDAAATFQPSVSAK